ncbi:MAG TPA: universal stress protein [Acidimicrobiia bacterium]|nr:universal stress protein [Acidimicrobiia bacterium]
MPPSVIAGIDLTAMGRRVADRARIVAESSGADLALVHVLEAVGEAMIQPSLARLMQEHQRAEAGRVSEWVAKRTTARVDLEVIKGSPAWELVARAKKADLVVLGSSTVDAFAGGPVSLRVARMATSDVLIVRRQPRAPYRKVIAAVDFSEASRKAVERALEVFPEAELTVMYSLPSRFDPILSEAGLFDEEVDASRRTRMETAQDRMLEFTQSWNGRVKHLVTDGPPNENIDEAVRRRSADLVVVGSRGASATRMVLLGTVPEALVGHGPCDVYIARFPSTFRRP